MLLTRSWAKAAENRKQKENRQKETQKETNTSSLDPQTVQFLLTWKPMSTCLKLIGNPASYQSNSYFDLYVCLGPEQPY